MVERIAAPQHAIQNNRAARPDGDAYAMIRQNRVGQHRPAVVVHKDAAAGGAGVTRNGCMQQAQRGPVADVHSAAHHAGLVVGDDNIGQPQVTAIHVQSAAAGGGVADDDDVVHGGVVATGVYPAALAGRVVAERHAVQAWTALVVQSAALASHAGRVAVKGYAVQKRVALHAIVQPAAHAYVAHRVAAKGHVEQRRAGLVIIAQPAALGGSKVIAEKRRCAG